MTAVHCLGCGTNLTTGTYRRLLCSDATKHVAPSWREIIGIVLERNRLVINEEDLFGDGSRGFVCRKCFRAFESFQTAKDKLLLSAYSALKHIPTSPKPSNEQQMQRKRLLHDGDCSHDLMSPTKRPRTIRNPVVGSSPAVQVRHASLCIRCIVNQSNVYLL